MVRYRENLMSVTRRKRKRSRPTAVRRPPLSGGGMNYYASRTPLMRGRGLGGVLLKFARRIIPMLKNSRTVRAGLKKVGRSAALAGIEAAQSALQPENPQPFAKALVDTSKKQARGLLKDARRQFAGPPPPKTIKRPMIQRRKVPVGKRGPYTRSDILS